MILQNKQHWKWYKQGNNLLICHLWASPRQQMRLLCLDFGINKLFSFSVEHLSGRCGGTSFWVAVVFQALGQQKNSFWKLNSVLIRLSYASLHQLSEKVSLTLTLKSDSVAVSSFFIPVRVIKMKESGGPWWGRGGGGGETQYSTFQVWSIVKHQLIFTAPMRAMYSYHSLNKTETKCVTSLLPQSMLEAEPQLKLGSP